MDNNIHRCRIGVCFFVVLALALMAGASAQAEGPKWIGAFYVKGKVGLKWKAVDGAGTYNVYRKALDSEYAQIATAEKTQHFDTELAPGSEYTYKIAAVGADGTETFGGEKSVTIPGMAAGSFVAPTWSGARVDGKKIFLRWDNMQGVMAFNIYRSTTSGSDYDVIGNATGNRYIDEDLEKGTTYYYVITALNEEFEETEYSEEINAKYGLSEEEKAAIAKANEIVLEELNLSMQYTLMETGGSASKFNQTAGVWIDKAGNIFSSDPMNNRIVVFDAQGKFVREFGKKCPSQQILNPPPGAMVNPGFLVGDNNGNIYVTDTRSHSVHVFTTGGDFVKRLGQDVPEGNKKPFSPNGIAISSDGRIVVTDTPNQRMIIFDQNGKMLKSIGSKGEEAGGMNYPGDVCLIGDTIICELDIIGCRIQLFDFDGNYISGFGEVGTGPGLFGRPGGVAWGDNKIWVTDAMHSIIQAFSIDGTPKNAFLTVGEQKLVGPTGIKVANNSIYVCNSLDKQLLVIKF